MRSVLRIARTELSLLLCSPVGWLTLIVFSIQCSMVFLQHTEAAVWGIKLHDPMWSAHLTLRILGANGLYDQVSQNIYLYIPLITMGLMSREYSTGSIKLLQSSPITPVQIILGKYVGMVAFASLFMIILLVYVVSGCYLIHDADTGSLVSGFIGIYLLIAAYSAIGLLASGLTAYQLVAAFSTFTILAGLSYLGQVGQDNVILGKVTYLLSMSNRSADFIAGLISSKNVVYYLLITVLMLTIGIGHLYFRKGKNSFKKQGGWLAIAFLLIIFTGYLSTLPYLSFYKDLSGNQANTVSTGTQNVLKQIHTPLSIDYYVNLFDSRAIYYATPSKQNKNKKDYEPYQRFLNKKISSHYIYYYDSTRELNQQRKLYAGLSDRAIAEKISVSWKIDFRRILSPDQIRKLINPDSSQNRTFQLLKANNRQARLGYFSDLFTIPLEPEIADALQQLVAPPVKVSVVTDGQSRSVFRERPKDYQVFATKMSSRAALLNHGFTFRELSICSQPVPNKTDILLLADPQNALDKAVLNNIEDYLSAGGNLLIAANPGDQTCLNPLLATLGLSLTDGELRQDSKYYDPDFIVSHIPPSAGKLSPFFNDLVKDENRPVNTPGALAIKRTGQNNEYSSQPMLQTEAATGTNDTLKKTYIVGVALSRKVNKKIQRIAVLGDADCLSNQEILRAMDVKGTTANDQFATALFGWLSGDHYPVYTEKVASKDNSLNISRTALPQLKFWLQIMLTGVLLLIGLAVIYIRKRK